MKTIQHIVSNTDKKISLFSSYGIEQCYSVLLFISLFLDDSEYDADLQKCEYIESAKRVIIRTSHQMGNQLATLTENVTITDAGGVAATVAPTAPSATIRLPPMKLEPFSGDIETWEHFWEQFKQSIDNDPSLTTINKHIFLGVT
jgi:hypothetical protein